MARAPNNNSYFQHEYITTFDQILLQAARSGVMHERIRDAREWFRNRAQEMTHVTARRILREEERDRFSDGMPDFGRMYLYVYDPKFKDDKTVLPYYDHYPVCIPLQPKPGKTKDGRPCAGFLGLNMHYLPLKIRAALMDAMYPRIRHPGERRYDQQSYLNVNYEILKGLAGLASKYFTPALKHYLFPHLRSRIMKIYPVEWDIALFLPIAQWSGATEKMVWQDAERIIRGERPIHADRIRAQARAAR